MLQAELDALVLQAQGGSESALSVLIAYLHPKLLSFALHHCGQAELAKDAVQEAWIKGIKSLKTLDDPRVFRAWMIRAVKWRLVDLVRKDSHLVLGEAVTPEVTELETEQALPLARLVADLPEIEREAIMLFYQQECQLNEIALIQDVPVGTVKSRLNRAKGRLKARLEAEQ